MKRLPENLSGILLIIIVTVATYGLLISQLGFYRDDWYLLATAQSEGSAGVIRLFLIDRPLTGYFYVAALRLLGFSPIAWQVTTLLLRVIGNLLFWQMLRTLWPGRHNEALAISLLFAVYPGYSVQPNAGVYCTDLMAQAAALTSMVLMLQSLRLQAPGARMALVSLVGILQLFYLGMFESAVGLEVARFAIIWYVYWRTDRSAFRTTTLKAFRAGAPYLLLTVAFLIWRVFIFQSTRRATNLDVILGRYAVLPFRSILTVVVEMLKDLFETVVLAWTVPFYRFVSSAQYRDLALATVAAAVVVSAILLLARQARHEWQQSPPPNSDEHLHMMLLGAVISFFALLPIDLAGRNVLFTDQWDRYTLYASSGVALLVGATLFRFLGRSARAAVLLALVAMSVFVHYFSAASYRDFWAAQRDLWQQLLWRAPGIRNGTMLFVAIPVGGYQEGYEIYGPANMIYYPGQSLQIGGDVINASTVTALQLGKNRQHYDRSVLVQDNYSAALVALYPTSHSCLHVLDGRKIELPGPVEDSLAFEAALYSKLTQIETQASPVLLPGFLRGHSPRPWCGYYQRMDLARQKGDWNEVARQADEALAMDLTPDDASEWMPALEAYTTLGRMQEARRAAAIIRAHDASRAFLCLQLQRGAVYPAPYDYNQVNQILCQAK